MTDDKTRETRLRRMADRQGLRIVKSRRRDPYATDYGRMWIVSPGEDREATDPAFPFVGRPARGTSWNGYDTLDEIEDALTDRDRHAR